jgi:uncharacterized protein DUF6602
MMSEEAKPTPSAQDASREDKKSQSFPRLALLKAMQSEAAGLIAARTKAVLIHNVKNISAAGGVVETTVREVLRKRLPSKYYVGQGHIVSPTLKTSPQFDVIVANSDSSPVLFQDDNGTEWFPFEGVYAIGEVKSSYDKRKKPIEAFSENIRRTKTEFNWPKRDTIARAYEKGGGHVQNTIAFDQLFSFMVFVDSGNFKPEEIEEFYKDTPAEYLPNIPYLVDQGVMLSMKFGGVNGAYPMEMNLYPEVADKMGLVQYKSKWCLRIFKDDEEEVGLGMAFFTFYYLLMSHLEGCKLRPMSLLPYYVLSTVDVGPRMHLHILD